MAVPVGLLLYGARQIVAGNGVGAGGRRSAQAVEKLINPVKRWLQDFF
jgi:hypothetical protein